jgi:ABC-type nickel/cobalt efflux system permease component RcnA
VQLSFPSFAGFSQVFAENPSLVMMQMCMVAVGVLLVYLVLYATRDILLRTHSFLYQIAVIVLVAVLPVVGFLLYLLIRPATTNRQREFEREVRDVLKRVPQAHHQKKQNHQHNHKHHSKPKPQA